MTQPYRIPDIFEGWRWKTSRNPHYEEARAESLAWFRSFEDFYRDNRDSIEGCDGSKSVLPILVYDDADRCRFGVVLFVAWGLPEANKGENLHGGQPIRKDTAHATH